MGSPDHAPIVTTLPCEFDMTVSSPPSLKPGSKEEKSFLDQALQGLRQVYLPDDPGKADIERATEAMAKVFADAWEAHAKSKRVCARSKAWWDADCAEAKATADESRLWSDQSKFKRLCKQKRKAFNHDVLL